MFDILPHGAVDSVDLDISAGGTFYSSSVDLDAPQYAALALMAEVLDDALAGAATLTIQTQVAGSGQWIDTTSIAQIDAASAVGIVKQLACVDPVLSRVRLKVDYGGNSLSGLRVTWLADKPITIS